MTYADLAGACGAMRAVRFGEEAAVAGGGLARTGLVALVRQGADACRPRYARSYLAPVLQGASVAVIARNAVGAGLVANARPRAAGSACVFPFAGHRLTTDANASRTHVHLRAGVPVVADNVTERCTYAIGDRPRRG